MRADKETLLKVGDEGVRIECRAELCIKILEKITYKNTTTDDDMKELRHALKLLKDEKIY